MVVISFCHAPMALQDISILFLAGDVVISGRNVRMSTHRQACFGLVYPRMNWLEVGQPKFEILFQLGCDGLTSSSGNDCAAQFVTQLKRNLTSGVPPSCDANVNLPPSNLFGCVNRGRG